MNTIIKCGNCGANHSSVSEVRSCYGNSGRFNGSVELPSANDYDDVPLPKKMPSVNRAGVPMITRAQESFLNSLLEERPTTRSVENMFPENVAKLTKREASDWITTIKASPKEVAPASLGTDVAPPADNVVPAGRYAIDIDDTVKFYHVDRPTEGRRAGRVFVSVQASDDTFPIRKASARQEVLEAIVSQGIQESMLRYGKEIGRCGHCGRTLTNEESIERGIGPVCAAKMGW